MYAFLTRDGISPARFRDLARRELLKYPNVRFAALEVRGATREGTGFVVQLGPRRQVGARKLLIATGVLDALPALPGIETMFGRSVFQCPYCDGWELRGARIAVYGHGQRGFQMARAMTAWTRDIVLFTNGASGYSREQRAELKRNAIVLNEKRILRLEGMRGRLKAVVVRPGDRVARDALFFDTPSYPQSDLAQSLGCQFNRNGGVRCGDYEATSVPGVFVAGNITRDVQLSIVAAAEGARAAFGINRALTREDFEKRASGKRRIEHPRLHAVRS
jgi:thioredoxin reductase